MNKETQSQLNKFRANLYNFSVYLVDNSLIETKYVVDSFGVGLHIILFKFKNPTDFTKKLSIELLDPNKNLIKVFNETKTYSEADYYTVQFNIENTFVNGQYTLTILSEKINVPAQWKNRLNTKSSISLKIDTHTKNKSPLVFRDVPSFTITEQFSNVEKSGSFGDIIEGTLNLTNTIKNKNIVDYVYDINGDDCMFVTGISPLENANTAQEISIWDYEMTDLYSVINPNFKLNANDYEITNYYGTIIEVVNDSKLKVVPPVYFKNKNTQKYEVVDVRNIRHDVSLIYNTYGTSSLSSSYIRCDISNLENISGKLHNIELYSGNINDEEITNPVGTFEVKSFNLFNDNVSENKLIEYGNFRNICTLQTSYPYSWTFTSASFSTYYDFIPSPMFHTFPTGDCYTINSTLNHTNYLNSLQVNMTEDNMFDFILGVYFPGWMSGVTTENYRGLELKIKDNLYLTKNNSYILNFKSYVNPFRTYTEAETWDWLYNNTEESGPGDAMFPLGYNTLISNNSFGVIITDEIGNIVYEKGYKDTKEMFLDEHLEINVKTDGYYKVKFYFFAQEVQLAQLQLFETKFLSGYSVYFKNLNTVYNESLKFKLLFKSETDDFANYKSVNEISQTLHNQNEIIGDNIYYFNTTSNVYELVNNRLNSDIFGNLTASNIDVTGDVHIAGELFASAKHFRIPDKEDLNKYITYTSVEANENLVILRGKININEKEVCISFPSEWKWLINSETVTVMLSSEEYSQNLIYEISENYIKVKNKKLFSSSLNFSYLILAERKDIPKLKVNI